MSGAHDSESDRSHSEGSEPTGDGSASDRSKREYPFDEISDEEIEVYLSHLEDQEESYWNFSTLAGLALIVVGVVYLLEQLGLAEGVGVSLIANMLPWLAGVLIILVGFGMLSWNDGRGTPAVTSGGGGDSNDTDETRSSPSSEKTERTMNSDISRAARDLVDAVRRTLTEKRLTKSRDKKISGVCGGLAEYLGVDPTLMRIAWVAAAVFGLGSAVLIYLVLMLVMPGSDDPAPAQKVRIRISRD